MQDIEIEESELFHDAQLSKLNAVLVRKTPAELREIIADLVHAAHGSLLEEDHEGDSGTLGAFYTIIEEHGFRPDGNFYDTHCLKCQKPSDDGEGYGGLCGNCADRYHTGERISFRKEGGE